MPHLHLVVIRPPWRSTTVATGLLRWTPTAAEDRWPAATIRYPPWSATYRAQPSPAVTTRQRISFCHSTARSRQHPRTGTANAANISPDQSPSTHPAGLRRTSCAKAALITSFRIDPAADPDQVPSPPEQPEL